MPRDRANTKGSLIKEMKKEWQLYVLFLIPLLYFIIFCYLPMPGLLIVFQNYSPFKGILKSRWVGWKNFSDVFNSAYFFPAFRNTLIISLLTLINRPLAVIMAIFINYSMPKFKKMVQTITYMPHFISLVVLVGMLRLFTSYNGVFNVILKAVGLQPVNLLGIPSYFYMVFVLSGTWQNLGWMTIIYLAALTGVNPELHEAAVVDGASKVQRIWYVDIPAILPTFIIMLILGMGRIMSIGSDKALLMQNDLNITHSEILTTLSYKQGILHGRYSFGAALGLFQSLVNMILLLSVNALSRRITAESLW